MGIFKAVGRVVVNKVNNSVTKSAVKKVQTKAYQKTGVQLNKLKQQCDFVDGKQLYKMNKRNMENAERTKGKKRERFINDLFD
jgi:hypothetical protein